MSRTLILIFGVVSYAAFLVTILYAIGFEENILVPKGIDDGPESPVTTAVLINVLMLSVFAIQHTIMARTSFKAWWTKIVPEPIERSIFVLLTSIILLVTFWQWRPMTDVVWELDGVAANIVLGISFVGWGLVFYATFLIDHFDLFGLRQVVMHFRGMNPELAPFVTPTMYKYTRNPLMLGFLVAFWASPHMTQGHLLFTVVTTAYIFVGIQFEENTLKGILGEDYIKYRARTSMVIPMPQKKESE